MNIVVDATVPSVDVGNVVRLHHQVIHGGVETCLFIRRTCNLCAGKECLPLAACGLMDSIEIPCRIFFLQGSESSINAYTRHGDFHLYGFSRFRVEFEYQAFCLFSFFCGEFFLDRIRTVEFDHIEIMACHPSTSLVMSGDRLVVRHFKLGF